MKRMRHYLTFYLAAMVFAAGILGCATAKDVRRIVAQSNAAMIAGPPLDKAGVANSEVWREAVGQMDRIIAQNPDQTTLVNHLRVRQAMLLTVYQQGNIAEERWKMVDGNVLTTERDESLHENWKALVWWYKRAPNPRRLDNTEQADAREFMNTLDITVNGIDSHDLKIYLATLRAQMALKLASGANTRTAEQLTQVHTEMATDLEQYINVFTPEEQKWVQDHPETNVPDHLTVTDIRSRVWLRGIIREYRTTADAFSHDARDFGLPEVPTWRPAWIGSLNFN